MAAAAAVLIKHIAEREQLRTPSHSILNWKKRVNNLSEIRWKKKSIEKESERLWEGESEIDIIDQLYVW